VQEFMIMKRRLLLLIVIFCFSLNGNAEIIVPGDNFVTGWTTSGKALRFIKNDLFNYIDGGAELFHEFGFKELLVQSYRQMDNEIVLEVYQMDHPESALGIYLIKCGEETPIEGIEDRNSGNKYQFTIVKGSYFIQINSFTGEDKLIPVMIALAKQTLRFMPQEKSVKIFNHLPKENLIPGSQLIIRGPYGMQPIYTFGEGDILQLNGKIYAVVGDYKDEKNRRYTQIVIKYPNKKDALTVFENLLNNLDPYLEIIENFENGFVFKDYQNNFGIFNLKDDTVEIRIKLKHKPTDLTDKK